jgi:hypothetical protein
MSSHDSAVEISYGIAMVSSASVDASQLSNELTSGDVLTGAAFDGIVFRVVSHGDGGYSNRGA